MWNINIFLISEEFWEASYHLTSCWRTQNILLARWATKVMIMSCFTWLMTWLSAYCRPLRTPAQAFLTQGWVRLLELIHFILSRLKSHSASLLTCCRWTWRQEYPLIASMRLVLQELGPCWWSLAFWAAWLEIPRLSGLPDERSELCGAWGATKLVCWVNTAFNLSFNPALLRENSSLFKLVPVFTLFVTRAAWVLICSCWGYIKCVLQW